MRLTLRCHSAVSRSPLLHSMAPKRKSNPPKTQVLLLGEKMNTAQDRQTDHMHITCIITRCYNRSILLIVIIGNLFLRLIYKLNVIAFNIV